MPYRTPYSANELDERVTFQRMVEVIDDMGGHSHTWNDLITVWAHVRPMSGDERVAAHSLSSEANYLIVIRYRSDITEKDIALWKGYTFNLRFRKERGRSRFLEIEAERGVAT